jgi:hypothetical protein
MCGRHTAQADGSATAVGARGEVLDEAVDVRGVLFDCIGDSQVQTKVSPRTYRDVAMHTKRRL